MMTIRLLADTGEAAHPLPMDAAWFGITAIIVFALLLGVVFAFRSISNKH